MHATPIHRILSVEQLQVRRDENAILLQGAGANLLAISGVRDNTIDFLILKHAGQFVQVFINNETIESMKNEKRIL